jgi:transposase
MSLHLQSSIPSVPEDTARVAQAAFRRGNPYLVLRDRLGVMFEDADFADLYPRRGQAAYAPWRLALVTLLQFRETLSDRQAAEAVRARIDWKYLLGLDLTDEGFDHTVLCEFRGRLLEHEATERLLTRVLEVARGDGLLKARGRQRTDSTHVLAAVRQMNRIELLGETLRATLNTIARVAPDWLRVFAPTDWHERYDRRVEDMRLPATGLKRDTYIVQVGTDGHDLLDLLDASETPEVLRALPEVGVLRRVWARHFARGGSEKDDQEGKNKKDAKARQERKDSAGAAGTRLRSLRARGPDDRLESPYDIDARFRTKASKNWMGYMVHFTETCDTDTPHLVVHTETTPANVHEAMRTAAIHDALSEKELAPAEHLADSAYVSAAHIVAARERHGIDLVGPGRPDQSWQKQQESAFQTTDFVVDWENRRARCPEGHETTGWGEYKDKTSGRVYIRAGFNVADCRSCCSKSRCTRAASRRLNLHARPEHEALAATRARHESEAGRRLYDQRQGIEGTLSQGVRAFGVRRARYRGLVKVELQNVAIAGAFNIDRLAAWFAKRPLAPTRVSRFAALAA